MRAFGIVLLRDPDRLGYPWRQTVASFGPLAGTVAVRFGAGGIDLGDVPLPDDAPESQAVFRAFDLGPQVFRQAVGAGIRAAVREGATHILLLDADEAMLPAHVAALAAEAPPVAYLPRWTFWRSPDRIRLDWTVSLPRWALVKALLPMLERDEGDGSELPLQPGLPVAQFPRWPIFHYGRVGGSRHVARQRKATALLFAPESELDVPDEYDFVPRPFDCWLRGRQQQAVEGMFGYFYGRHPPGIAEWYTRVACKEGR